MRLRLVGVLAALAMTLTFAVSTISAATLYADVTGYAAGTAENNHGATWGDACSKIDSVDGSLGSSYVLPVLAAGIIYDQVIVKAGSDVSTDGHANTIFDNPVAGETVWADSNGSGAFDEGDKGISHIITCTAAAPTSVNAAAASITPPSCTAAGTLVIPADTASVMYSVSPAYSAGATGTFTVTATAKAGFVLTGTSQWALTVAPQLTGIACATAATAAAASITPPSCTAAGTLAIPADTAGVMYSVSPAYTAGATGTFTVTATAKAGFVLSGTSQWALTVAPKATDASCVTGGGTLPGNPSTPVRQGTLAGSVPNTAMAADAGSQLPIALVGLVMVAGAVFLGHRNLASVSTRR